MGTIKLQIRHGKTFNMPKEFGSIQRIMDQVAKDIIDNGIEVVLKKKKEVDSITFRFSEQTNQKLKEIAKNKGTTVTNLLQTSLENMKLISHE